MLCLSLVPRPDALHVRAGQLVKVAMAHHVSAGARQIDRSVVHRLSSGDDRPMRPRPAGRFVEAMVGDLAVEVRAVDDGRRIGYAYVAGAAATLHDMTIEPPFFQAARIERLVAIEKAIEEIGADAPADRIEELEEIINGELRRARESNGDFATLDLEAGDQYKGCAQAISQMWQRLEKLEATKSDADRTCHLLAMVYRNRRIARARSARGAEPGIIVVHSQPPRHGGHPPVTPFLAEMVMTAALPS